MERRFSVGFAQTGEVMIMRDDTTALQLQELHKSMNGRLR